ncbi:uncharacterized protein LOC120104380 [Phoenix dactylifera]|uniref:Uncharacterized protein LOC120104380 n=1 Tax=Phoenix dactylifera TaxID=42345 RepID=A0A8B8ZAY5_PHODC|nr:uncharacterized protein LOC120104380 [Phoenix dactylifera]
MASLLSSPSLPALSPSLAPVFYGIPRNVPSLLPSESLCTKSSRIRALVVSFALSESDSPKSLDDDAAALLPLLQDLADCLKLPPDYLARLPGDLRLDLNDAAFDLSNGPVLDECGQEVGEMLLNLSRAWEQADTSTSNSIARQLPSLESSLTDNVKPALGKRLVSAGRRFEAMGMYGQGEPQRIAKAMIKTGKLLSRGSAIETDERPKKESRMLKFGELQVELTPGKAYIGAAIGFVFGLLSWELSQGIQSIPESSLQYANDNALLLAKSLRGALLVLGFSSAVLSVVASMALVLLGRQLSSQSKTKKP